MCSFKFVSPIAQIEVNLLMIFSCFATHPCDALLVQDHSKEDNNNLLHVCYTFIKYKFSLFNRRIIIITVLELNRSPIVTASYATYTIHSTL